MSNLQRSKSAKKRAYAALDTSLFDAGLLRDEVALEVAIHALESHLANPAISIEELVESMMDPPHLLEFAISAVNDTVALILTGWILENFPTKAAEFSSSLCSKLLSRFSLYLLFLPYPSSAETPDSLQSCHHSSQLSLPVIEALASRVPFEESESHDGVGVDEFDFPVKRRGQKQKQQARKLRPKPSMDSKVFDALGVKTPSSEDEAAELEKKVLEDQRNILKHFLDIFRNPLLQITFQQAYIQALPSEGIPSDDAVQIDDSSSPTTEANDVPAAYPMVQPMKAALYFDSAEGFGDWRIIISTRADSDLRKAWKGDNKRFAIIVKKIRELSNGHFSPDNHKRLAGPDIEIPIFEAKMTGDSRLVYQVDCVPEYESDVERQVLKIFGIYTHAQLDRRFWEGVSYQLGRKGKEYKSRCVFRNKPSVSGDNVILPATFPAQTDVTSPMSAFALGIPDLHKDDLEKMHDLLVLEKYVTFSQALLNSILADQEVAHVFDVSPHEKRIIEHPSSCYVLGRSGTGKTTTMLFKMLGIQRSWQAVADVLPKPRQMFITQSRVLAEKVEEYFSKLYQSLSAANQSPEELARLVASRTRQGEQGLVDRDEEIDWRGDLPKRFSELEDAHFPMFVTVDQLWKLLEAEGTSTLDALNNTSAEVAQACPEENLSSNEYMQQRRATFVSYNTFLESYWAHFSQPLTKGLDPNLVFGEFIGVIKGSEQALNSDKGFLDKDTYYNLSQRSQATFANQRDRIYRLFLTYVKQKRERGEYDAADRTHAILSVLRKREVPGRLLDFIYVDEVQDNLLIDTLIIRMLCRNPTAGLFWAGDTAQTISAGSSFRFNDLKAFQHRIEMNAGTRFGPRIPPQSFQLAVNYRSHAGIVNCAHSVIELITQFWPHAIDVLAKEEGIIEGLKPVFLSGWDDDTVQYEQFLFGKTGSHIEFGAQQCILVRHDAARHKLRKQVGDIGLIMTLYESKGLEFNDVLLYNFFQDSTMEHSQWRVVLNALSSSKYAAPCFDDVRHGGICRELKFLYVAITRARKNVWIADGSKRAEPMRIYWTAKNQIQNCSPGTDVPRLAMSSSPEEWAATALTLFNNRRYIQAKHCYERASLPRETAVAYAYSQREKARLTPVKHRNGTTRCLAFTAAAEAFEASANEAVTEKRTYFRIAAECYKDGGDDPRAALAYLHASEFTLSAQHFRKAGMFDDAINVINSHRDRMSELTAVAIEEVARLYYLRERKLKEARCLFDTDDKALEYMEEYGLDLARVTFLEETERFSEAAELHLAEGRTLEAIELFTKDQKNSRSVRQAARCLLDGLRCNLSIGISPNSETAKSNKTLQELLRLLNILDISQLDDSAYDEVVMFRAIISGDAPTLLRLADRFNHWYHDSTSAMMCLDHAFSSSPKLQVASVFEVTSELQLFLLYVQLLRNLADHPDPRDDSIRRTFAFEQLSEETFLILPCTVLESHCTQQPTFRLQVTDRGFVLFRWDLQNLIRKFLCDRLRERVAEEDKVCRRSRSFQPCLGFVVHGRCNRPDCWKDHCDMASYHPRNYNARVRIHLQQVLIYHTLHGIENRWDQKLYWLHRLYEALHPPFFKLGGPHNLDLLMIPEFQSSRQVVKGWAQDQLFRLDPYVSELNFLTALVRMATISFNVDAAFTCQYIFRIPCVSTYRPPPYLLRIKGQEYTVPEMLRFIEGLRANSLAMGVVFVKHILENDIPIQISVLCDFLDRLCSMLVISHRFQQGSSLHEITLPRSWLVQAVPALEQLSGKEFVSLKLYIDPMTDLLTKMFTRNNAEHLLFENRNLATIGFDIRNVFIAQVCKNVCLLGYNIKDYSFRQAIWRVVTSIRKFDDRFSHLYAHYVQAKSWDDLAWTVRQSARGTSLDEMIQIHEASKTGISSRPGPNVRRIVYKTFDEIPSLLSPATDALPKNEPIPTLLSNPSSASPMNDGEVEYSEEVGDSMGMGHVQEAGAAVHEEQDEEGKEGAAEMALDAAELTFTAQTTVQTVVPTEEENAAATQIQIAYRRYKAREKNAAATQIQAAYRRYKARARGRTVDAHRERRRRVADGFFNASSSMDWLPGSYYQVLFLGPLPHLLVCLECARECIHSSKERAKKRLNEVAHLELEAVQANLTKLTKLRKEAVRLQNVLGLQSDLHKRKDKDELKGYAVSVEQLLRSLPADATQEWQDDLKIAMKGIVQEKRLAQKQAKPELNTDDLFEF